MIHESGVKKDKGSGDGQTDLRRQNQIKNQRTNKLKYQNVTDRDNKVWHIGREAWASWEFAS